MANNHENGRLQQSDIYLLKASDPNAKDRRQIYVAMAYVREARKQFLLKKTYQLYISTDTYMQYIYTYMRTR